MSPTNLNLVAPARRPYVTTFVLLLVAGILVAGPIAPAQNVRAPDRTQTSEAAPEMTEAPVPAERLRRVTGDRQFRAALEILESQNETIDTEGARLVTSKRGRGAGEIVFRVKVKGTDGPGEYGKLIFSEEKGKRPAVFFDEKREGGAPPPASVNSPSAAKICFKPWGSWKVLGTFCAYRYVCFFRNQKAIYLTETRSRSCPGGTQTQTRTVVVHCGC